MGLYSRQTIEQIVAECGNSNCHYCGRRTSVSYTGCPKEPHHATLDHKIPKSKGGTNARENLVLACNACNHAKADRTYEDFLAYPHPIKAVSARGAPLTAIEREKRRAAILKPAPKKPKPSIHPAYKARKGTLAAAINSGEVTECGMYKGTPRHELEPQPVQRIAPVPYHETMWILTGKRVPPLSEIFDKR